MTINPAYALTKLNDMLVFYGIHRVIETFPYTFVSVNVV